MAPLKKGRTAIAACNESVNAFITDNEVMPIKSQLRRARVSSYSYFVDVTTETCWSTQSEIRRQNTNMAAETVIDAGLSLTLIRRALGNNLRGRVARVARSMYI